MQTIGTVTPSIQQLIWLNRNDIKRVLANKRYASNGAIIVQQVVVDVGLPIEVGTSSGWMTRADFEALRTHNRTVLDSFTLTLGSDIFTVIWDNTSGSAITGQDLWDNTAGDITLTNVVMKFLTV